jgi:hypothetical protein
VTISILDGFEHRDRDGCQHCEMTGFCPTCDGFGTVPVRAPDDRDRILDYAPCSACSGSARCPVCCAHQVEAHEAGG